MMHIQNDFCIKCDKCGHMYFVEADSLECDTATYDRPMGDEIEYNFYGEICCDECDSVIDFRITGYEYPVGAFNFSNSECHGGEFIDEPSVDIEYEFDDYYYDKAYEKYERAESILEYNRKRIENMTSREFECFVAEIFEKMGFSVKVTQATRDGGETLSQPKQNHYHIH